MRRLGLVAGGVALAAALAVGGSAGVAAASSQQTGMVYVVHGIPDTPVDVYVDGARALDDFQPGTSKGPLALSAGVHQVKVFSADAPDGSGDPVISGSADVPAGGNVTLVANLDPQGSPTLNPFVNDVSSVPAGQARLVVRHTAAAPAVDVLAGGKPVVSGLTNPDQEALVVPADTVSASVAAAGTTKPLIGPAELPLQEGTTTFVHAIGSLDKNSLDLVTFTVKGMHSAPSGVPAGAPSGAPAADDTLLGGAGALTVLGLALTAGSLARSRRVSRS